MIILLIWMIVRGVWYTQLSGAGHWNDISVRAVQPEIARLFVVASCLCDIFLLGLLSAYPSLSLLRFTGWLSCFIFFFQNKFRLSTPKLETMRLYLPRHRATFLRFAHNGIDPGKIRYGSSVYLARGLVASVRTSSSYRARTTPLTGRIVASRRSEKLPLHIRRDRG